MIQDHWASAYLIHCLFSVRHNLKKNCCQLCFISAPKKGLHFCFPESCWITSLCRICSSNGLSLMMWGKKKKANLYQKMKHVIWVSWGKVILTFFNASCCSVWELKGIECSFSLLLLHDLCLTIYVAVLRPALAPQETSAKVLLDFSVWGDEVLV